MTGDERRTGEYQTFIESLGVEPWLAAAPIETRRSAQMGMVALLFAAEAETWPALMAWLDKHAPERAAMMRELGAGPDTFRAAADILAGLDVGLHMLGIHEPRLPGT